MAQTPRSWWVQTSAAGLCAAAALGFLAARVSSPAHAWAADKPASEYDKRIVAYLHGGKVPITREDLGEYLIARQGAEKIELLVNKFIIDHACKEKGIEVTAAEIEAALAQDLKGIAVNRKQFVETVLKQYNKTLYEWKEDVLRPRLQLQKLCKLEVTVSEEELKEAFDSQFGPQVEGRIIIWPKGQEKFALKEFDDIRASDDGFEEKARSQTISSLAATGGRIKAFGKGTGTNPELEREAFKLKPGQVSTLITTKEGIVCFKLDRIYPANADAQLDNVREQLHSIVYEKKIALEIPKYFAELRKTANPQVFYKKNETTGDLERVTEALLQTGATSGPNK